VDKSTLKHLDTVQAMNKRGMSQRQIADAVGISLSTVNRLVNYNPASEPGSIDYMIAQNDKRRAKGEEIYAAYHRCGCGHDAARGEKCCNQGEVDSLWEQVAAL
jgi:predicted transcriptional regulator